MPHSQGYTCRPFSRPVESYKSVSDTQAQVVNQDRKVAQNGPATSPEGHLWLNGNYRISIKAFFHLCVVVIEYTDIAKNYSSYAAPIQLLSVMKRSFILFIHLPQRLAVSRNKLSVASELDWLTWKMKKFPQLISVVTFCMQTILTHQQMQGVVKYIE